MRVEPHLVLASLLSAIFLRVTAGIEDAMWVRLDGIAGRDASAPSVTDREQAIAPRPVDEYEDMG